jgi:hypothetical protein
MDTPLLNDRDMQFLLYEFLDTQALLARSRYAEHSREVFDATLATAKAIAEKNFANHNAKGDAEEPQFDGESVHLIPETQAAWDAFAGAAILGYQGYNCALAYARQRPQGRLPSNKNSASAQVNIIQHADVRRLLLSQKAYAEGGLALCLYASSLMEESRTAASAQAREDAFTLLDLITPIVKSWPSKYGLKANDNAIQVLGGAGYMREYPVEQYYRDNRLNPIHEGTEGIQALDLLGRKVPQKRMAGYQLLNKLLTDILAQAEALPDTQPLAGPLAHWLEQFNRTTTRLMTHLAEQPDATLANATVYLDAFGRVLVSGLWLKQAAVAAAKLPDATGADADFYRGKIQAARYYLEWELPEVGPALTLLDQQNTVCLDMQDAWF